MIPHTTPSSFRRAGKKWTDEEEAELRKRLAAGEGLQTISVKMERVAGGVYAKAQQLGLPEIYGAALQGHEETPL